MFADADFLGASQQRHGPRIRPLLQQPRLVELPNQAKRQHGRQKVAELASDHGVVAVDPRFVEPARGLVVPHDDFDLPPILVHLVDDRRLQIQIALQHDCPERRAGLAVGRVVVGSVLLRLCEIGGVLGVGL